MITFRRMTAAVAALALCGSVLLFAQEPKAADEAAVPAPPTAAGDPAVSAAQDAQADTTKRAGKARLTKPWKNLSSLSDEQKSQIAAIHRKAVQEIKAVEKREREEIMALLNDEQKSELQAVMDKAAAERKARKPAKEKKGAAATTPD